IPSHLTIQCRNKYLRTFPMDKRLSYTVPRKLRTYGFRILLSVQCRQSWRKAVCLPYYLRPLFDSPAKCISAHWSLILSYSLSSNTFAISSIGRLDVYTVGSPLTVR